VIGLSFCFLGPLRFAPTLTALFFWYVGQILVPLLPQDPFFMFGQHRNSDLPRKQPSLILVGVLPLPFPLFNFSPRFPEPIGLSVNGFSSLISFRATSWFCTSPPPVFNAFPCHGSPLIDLMTLPHLPPRYTPGRHPTVFVFAPDVVPICMVMFLPLCSVKPVPGSLGHTVCSPDRSCVLF